MLHDFIPESFDVEGDGYFSAEERAAPVRYQPKSFLAFHVGDQGVIAEFLEVRGMGQGS
jgi:hypothetical protein